MERTYFILSKLTTNAQPLQQAALGIQTRIAKMQCEELVLIMDHFLTDLPPSTLQNYILTMPSQQACFSTGAAHVDRLVPNAMQNVKIPIHKAILVAPGSSYNHHTYPGGLIIHTVLNLRAVDRFKKLYRLSGPEYETLIAAHIVHDLLKAHLLVWRRDGLPVAEPRLSGTGAHHVLCLAYLLLLGAPPRLLKAVASIHAHPRNEPGRVMEFLSAGAQLIGIPPTEFSPLMTERPREMRLEMLAYLGERYWWEYSIVAERAARAFMFESVKKGRLSSDWPPPNLPEHRWAQNFMLAMLTEINIFQYLRRGQNRALQRLKDAENHLRRLGLWPVDLILS